MNGKKVVIPLSFLCNRIVETETMGLLTFGPSTKRDRTRGVGMEIET